MRKLVCISMLFLFFATVITGFAEGHIHPGQSGIHTVLAVLFVISTVTHMVVNRKSLVRHFMGTPGKAR
jgi:hypothetical protein